MDYLISGTKIVKKHYCRIHLQVSLCSCFRWAVAYELENIESKICQNIDLASSENLNFDVPEFLKDLDQECSKVKKAFKHQVVSFENERLVERYFHFHQESLIDLIDRLYSDNQPGNPFLQCILDRLSGLLSYLEEHFPEYFDPDMKMPVAFRGTIRSEFEGFIVVLSDKFQNSKVDMCLVDLLKNVYASHIQGKPSLSFRQFYYLKLLRVNIEGIDASLSNMDTLQVIKVLMRCNLNVEAVYNFIIEYIGRSMNKEERVFQKLDLLAYYLKLANQESASAGVAFDHTSPPINIQVGEWISQEIQYLKHKQQLLSSISAEEIVPSEFKLNFDLSVAALACLFRALVETGIVKNKNTSELIRFLTKYARTRQSEVISYESFRIKYYAIEDGTKDAVKRTLQSVLNFTNKH